MDPNKTLQELLEQCKSLQDSVLERDDPDLALSDALFNEEDVIDQLNCIVSGVQDLNEWIEKGGFLPAVWENEKRQKLLQAQDTIFRIRVENIMYPEENPLQDWSTDTIEEIKNQMDEMGLIPQRYHDAFDAQFEDEDKTG